MRDYGLHISIGDARFVAAAMGQLLRAKLYRFGARAGTGEDLNENRKAGYGLAELGYPAMPSVQRTGDAPISLAEDVANDADYWLGRYTLTDLVVRVPGKGVLLINDATVSVSKQKEIVKTALVGRKGTIKEYITDGDYQLTINIGVVAVDSENKPIDQYPEKAMAVLREIFELDESLEVSSAFLDVFGINRIAVTGFSASQMTYSNRQTIEVSALSDDDYIIQSTDY